MTFRIIQGDNRDTLKTLADNSIDAIVTDPPYGIDFLGKSWDANTGALETYQECLRVLKPGGHILAFSAARTYHHLAVTLEQAGFEIRDQIMWIYSSGFPKSQDIGRSIQRSLGVKETIPQTGTNAFTTKGISFSEDENREYEEKKGKVIPTDPEAQKWEGWGTALKPAHEPIALARKPIKCSIKDNVQKHGVGALNIDATRIPTDELKPAKMGAISNAINAEKNVNEGLDSSQDTDWFPNEGGRFPSNVIGEIPDHQKYFYNPKPEHEPIALARKPIKGSIKDNVQKHGTGALNIDATRIPYANEADLKTYINNIAGPLERSTANEGDGIKMFEGKVGFKVQKGTVKRLPSAGKRTASFHNATGGGETVSGGDGSPEFEANPMGRFPSNVIGEILQEDYQKYFYCPKVSRKERHIGFDDLPKRLCGPGGDDFVQAQDHQRSNENTGNNHPTVKPIELMKYLIKLITPPGGIVLDPFNGSGSTGCAAVELGFNYIGCELDPAYVDISLKRIAAWTKQENIFGELFTE